MKTAKKYLSSLIVLLLVLACEHNHPDIGEPPQKKGFHLKAEMIGESVVQQENIKLDIPAASSCNIGEAVIVSIFAITDHQTDDGSADVPFGSIEFVNPASGCYLMGEFKGTFSNGKSKLLIEASIDVDYGIGLFEADGGNLKLTIEGTELADQQMKYSVAIDGYLEKHIS